MKNRIPYIILFLVSFVIVAVFSTSTTFLYHEPCAGDSAVFQIVGKYWAEGRIPYLDVWDQKGPLVYFFDAIGYSITGNQLGIFLLQIINITIVSWILYLICRIEFNKTLSVFFTTLVLFSFAPVCENTVEEWMLIPLCLAYYYMFQWVDKVSETRDAVLHPLGYACLYGIVLGLSLMSRLTNGVGICIASLIIAIYLLRRGEWKNVLANLLSFTCGFMLVTLPFVLYFYMNDALYEMWYGTFLYNAEYAGSSGFNFLSLKGFANIILRFENCYYLIFVSVLILSLNSQRRFAGLLWLFMSAACMAWFLRSNGFGQYATICLPFSCISLIELHRLNVMDISFISKWSWRLGTVGYVAVVIVGAVYDMWLFNHMYRENVELTAFRTFMKDIPSDYKQSFAAYNCPSDWYLYEDIHPYYRFFVLQDFQTSMGESLLPKVREDFSGKVKWLLVKGEKTKIDDILRRNYRKTKQKEGTLILYMHK